MPDPEEEIEQVDIDRIPSVDGQPPYDLSDEDYVAYDDGVDIADHDEPERPEGGVVPDNPDAA